MGEVIDIQKLPVNGMLMNRLLIYYKTLQKLAEPQSISKELAEALLLIPENRRSMKLGQVFNKVLDRYPEGVTIKDIDVMFNPNYSVDVLKILIDARKRKHYYILWPGRLEDEKLIYGEEGDLDYKVYKISDYDVICVR